MGQLVPLHVGVTPNGKKFEPTLFKRERMLAEVQEIAHQNTQKEGTPNRLGVLLGNKVGGLYELNPADP
jgi:hypothetical protein